MKFFIAAAAAAASSQALTVEEAHIGAFNRWKDDHSKTYSSIEEESLRFEVFMKNKEEIEAHNRRTDTTYKKALNHFADLTAEEFKQRSTGFRPLVGHTSLADSTHLITKDAPETIDWVKQGKVTAVKNQGQCGSCWAFSTTGSVEAANLIKNGGDANDDNLILSEQQLVDCSKANHGCNGGLMDMAFDYLKKKLHEKGDDTESSYPYKGADGMCKRLLGKPSHIQVTGHVDIPVGDEDALLNAVGTVGPVSIAIEADQKAFQFYSSGVLKADCGEKLDHGVLVAGYGTDEDGTDYWLVKNSWGPSWGEEGYIKLARGSNLCGIANSASYPIVA